MGKSPGHRKWPDHRIREEKLQQRTQVWVDGNLVADSSDVIKVAEDRSPVRYYFPRVDVRMDQLERSETTTQCPFKGVAQYFSLNAGSRQHHDAAWSYEDPYEEHAQLKDRVAFHDDRIPQIQIRPV